MLAHPGPANGLARNVGAPLGTGTTAILTGQVFRTAFAGEPVDLFLYNNTFSNMPVGVRMNSDTGNDDTAAEQLHVDPAQQHVLQRRGGRAHARPMERH